MEDLGSLATNGKREDTRSLSADLLKTGGVIALALLISYGTWYGLQKALGTPNPWVVVTSGSMIPTYYRGDLLFVKGAENRSGIPIGNVVIFHSPYDYDTLIVHRIVSTIRIEGQIYYRTQGDNKLTNPQPDPWNLDPQQITGVVLFRVPVIGNLVFIMQSQAGPLIIAVLIIGIFAADLFSLRRPSKSPAQPTANSL